MAGNMFMAALLDAGLSRKALEAALEPLPLEFKLKLSRVERGGFAARYVDVAIPGRRRKAQKKTSARKGAAKKKASRDHSHAHSHSDSHTHSHSHDHAHAHAHAHTHTHAHDEHHLSADGHGRSWREIERLLGKSKLTPTVRDRALAIFEGLAKAEATVHGRSLDSVHFHEVGMVDAIVDVTAAAAGLELLGGGRVTCTPIGIGHGFVDTAHGLLSVPTPATLALLKGVPTHALDVEWETITPTGAAIVREVVDEFVSWPGIRVDRIGVGAGRERPGPVPNVVRVVVGAAEGGLARDRVAVLETNLDDLVPEHFDHLLDCLMDRGALDVSIQHVQMKKNRPGFLLRVLCPPAARDELARTIFAESTAIGLRHQEWDRLVLERRTEKVETPWGRLRIKVVSGPDGRQSFSAEYDDCKKAARRSGEPLHEIVRQAEDIARATLEESKG